MLKEEKRLRVFLNRAPRKIFGHKRKEIAVESRKLHEEELHDL
jgi:hypothetical protein